jgi:hypothetical protein
MKKLEKEAKPFLSLIQEETKDEDLYKEDKAKDLNWDKEY